MSDKIIHLTDADFDEKVLKANGLILVDFYGEWCGPCKLMSPRLEEIANEYAGKVIIGKLDVDGNPKTTEKYNVRGIPTLNLFKDGTLLDTKVGALSTPELKKFLNTHL